MSLYGLIGRKLGHSFSPGYFSKKFTDEGIDAEYRIFEIDAIEKLHSILEDQPNLVGFNVTIPYKKEILYYLDEIDDVAKEVGAVNTVKVHRDGKRIKLTGFNTDVIGFERSLRSAISDYAINKALVLGTGGSAQAVSYVLKKMQIKHLFVSRVPQNTNQLAYQDVDDKLILNYPLIINTTPLGMYPEIESKPDIPYQSLSDKYVLFDLIYNPAETAFLKAGREQGAITKSGMEMLVIQAEEAWKIWQTP